MNLKEDLRHDIIWAAGIDHPATTFIPNAEAKHEGTGGNWRPANLIPHVIPFTGKKISTWAR